MAFFNKNKNSESNPSVFKCETKEEEKNKSEEEWVEVEGYKGVTEDLKGYSGFQYEIGVTYHHDGPVILCESGFHFCLTLENAISCTSIRYRFFKVKAITRKYYVDRGEYKLAANSITLLEEIPIEEVFKASKSIQTDFNNNFSLFKKYRENDINYWALMKEYIISELINCGYSETFALIYYMKKVDRTKQDLSPYNSIYSRRYIDWNSFNFAKALADEGVSTDMRTYLLLTQE